jgi:hypothetical protein
MSKFNPKAISRALLPNTEGFTFMATMKDGSIQRKKIVKDEQGLHDVEDFTNIESWFRIK